MENVQKYIQSMANTGEEIYACVCEVLSVNEGKATAAVQPLEGKSPIEEVYLSVDNDHGGILTVPKVGSKICVAFISKDQAVAVSFSEVEKSILKIGTTQAKVTEEGIAIERQGKNLMSILEKMIDEISKIVVVQGTTINIAAMTAIKEDFKTILK